MEKLTSFGAAGECTDSQDIQATETHLSQAIDVVDAAEIGLNANTILGKARSNYNTNF